MFDKFSDRRIAKINFLREWSWDFKITMGLIFTGLVALILTVAGLLTSQNWSSYYKSPFVSRHDKFHSNPELMESAQSIHLSSLTPLSWNSKAFAYNQPLQLRSSDRTAKYEGWFDGHHGEKYGIEKSDLYYVLPILLVIGLGSFLIPIISTFLVSLVTSNQGIGGCCGRRKRRGSVLEVTPIFGFERINDMWSNVERAIEKLTNTFDSKSSSDSNEFYELITKKKKG